MTTEQILTLTVNGAQRSFDGPLTGADLLAQLDIPAATAVAELNGRIVPRDEFAAHELSNGDVLELVTLVGGG